jgi:Tol biopolymer transport system component
VASRRKSREKLAWIVAAVLAVATLVTGGALLLDTEIEPQVLRAEIAPAPDTVFSLSPAAPGPVVVSPNGRTLAWAAVGISGVTRLWVRNLDETQSREVEGSDAAAYPFWSPDSRTIGYFAEGKIKRVLASGGPSITIGEAVNPKGGTWSPDGLILFAPSHNSAIYQIKEDGGEVSPVTELSESREENSHRHPRFLADGRHFVYFTRVGAMGTAVEGSGIWIGSIDGGEPIRLTHASSQAEFASGHLLFARGNSLLAQAFDPDGLEFTGEPRTVVEGVAAMSGAAIAAFTVSQQGMLAYQIGGGDLLTELVWFNREGARLKSLGDPAYQSTVQISPDQTRAAVTVGDEETGAGDIWIYDLEREVRSRFTFDPSEDVGPVWTPDGQQIYWSSGRVADFDIYVKTVDGADSDREVLSEPLPQIPRDVSPDGGYLAYWHNGATNTDLRLLPLEGDSEPVDLIANEFNSFSAKISPDGRWFAYDSDESGQLEVYVSTFPEPGRKWQVSAEGGTQPRWREDGRELYFLTPTAKMMVAEVDDSGSAFQVGQVRELFNAPRMPLSGGDYDVTGDGQRFLMNTVGDTAFQPITLVVNWTEELD